MTQPIDLEIGDRVQFWATFPYGEGFWKSKRLGRETDRMVPGTVVSVSPLRVLWDFTGKDQDGNDGPPREYPLSYQENTGYERSCVRKLPPHFDRDCGNCYYHTQEDCLPRGAPICRNILGPRNLHKWRPAE